MICLTDFNIDSWAACGAALTYLALKEPAKAVGGVLADCVHKCYENITSILEKYHKLREQNHTCGENLREVDPKFGILWYQSAALEGNEVLQDLWATLLMRVTDKNFKGDLNIAFIEILRTLTPVEVTILRTYYDFLNENYQWDTYTSANIELSLDKDVLLNELDIKDIELEASLLNLERCQLVTTFHNGGNVRINGLPSVNKGAPSLTALGVMFIDACIASSSAEV